MTARVQRDMDTRTTHHYLSIASGIGGLDLGVELGSGGSALPVCYVEIEATASAILASRMEEGALPPGPIWDDLHTFDGSAWRGLVDGIVGGYPCQPFSTAGRQRGFDDERNLWPAIERLVSVVRPGWCFFENVEGHLRLGYFDFVKSGLEALGYRVEAQICAASDVGATHRRRRLFVLAVADSPEPRLQGPWQGARDTSRSSDQAGLSEVGPLHHWGLWPTGEGSLPRQKTSNPGNQSSESPQTSHPQLNPRFVEWLMGLPKGWVSLAPSKFVFSETE